MDQFPALGIVYFFIKSLLVLLALMWVRATYPRLRIDQMMTFCWKVLVPATLAVVVIVAVGSRVTTDRSINAVIISVANIVALFVTLGVVGRSLRRDVERRKAALSGRSSAQV